MFVKGAPVVHKSAPTTIYLHLVNQRIYEHIYFGGIHVHKHYFLKQNALISPCGKAVYMDVNRSSLFNQYQLQLTKERTVYIIRYAMHV